MMVALGGPDEQCLGPSTDVPHFLGVTAVILEGRKGHVGPCETLLTSSHAAYRAAPAASKHSKTRPTSIQLENRVLRGLTNDSKFKRSDECA